MRVFHKLMDYHLNEAEEGRAKESLGVLRNMVGEQVRSKPRYRCQKCGFTAHSPLLALPVLPLVVHHQTDSRPWTASKI
ncbi:tetratricopeptide repeat protein [Raoultella terrigena]|uniref:Tetratricopeptide repeat protein n=1 Tax=Raoultella terrigena TaxID=577 RepID=A0A4U9CRQ6_RAOTE|nr:tetratricopeptide repeat protein [Raoultella terrigena]